MGLRGKLPDIITVQAEPLADLTPPDWLCAAGREHWERHADYLTANRLLTSATADSWAVCCDSWARLQQFRGKPTDRAYQDAVKQYDRHAKLWRLVPVDKPGAQVEYRHQDKPGFDFR